MVVLRGIKGCGRVDTGEGQDAREASLIKVIHYLAESSWIWRFFRSSLICKSLVLIGILLL